VLWTIFGTIIFHFHLLKMKMARHGVPGLRNNVTKCHQMPHGGGWGPKINKKVSRIIRMAPNQQES
jgi:hypothetical protein